MTTKEIYITPEIAQVELDNEISLQLNSDPNPLGDPNHWSSRLELRQNPMDERVS